MMSRPHETKVPTGSSVVDGRDHRRLERLIGADADRIKLQKSNGESWQVDYAGTWQLLSKPERHGIWLAGLAK